MAIQTPDTHASIFLQRWWTKLDGEGIFLHGAEWYHSKTGESVNESCSKEVVGEMSLEAPKQKAGDGARAEREMASEVPRAVASAEMIELSSSAAEVNMQETREKGTRYGD